MARKPSLSLETIHAPQRQWDFSHTPFRYNRLKKLRLLTIPKNFPSALFQLANQGLIAHIRSLLGRTQRTNSECNHSRRLRIRPAALPRQPTGRNVRPEHYYSELYH